jgi:hypothetical protein
VKGGSKTLRKFLAEICGRNWDGQRRPPPRIEPTQFNARQTRVSKAAINVANSGSIVMDAGTPKSADTHSHLVRPLQMEWQKTRFPGCEANDIIV